MSIQIGVNFEYKGKLSNFARDSFETLTDMCNVLDNDIDEGHISYCVETGKHYTFNRNNAIDVITGKWRLLTENPEDLKSVLNLKADKSELDTKVDKVDGKSLISDTEIARLATINNYDDTDIKNTINNKANTTDLTTHTSDTSIHITSSERTKWNNKAEMSDIPSLTNYATKTYVTDEIAKASTSGTVDLTGYAKTTDVNSALNTKVDKVTGKSLVSDTEIERLKNVDNYDDSNIKTSITNINSKLDTKANKSELFSGSYNDLTDKPTIPDISNLATKTEVNKKLSIQQAVGDAGKILKVGNDGNIEVVGDLADDISYQNINYPSWTNVKEALDGIMAKVDYIKPEITSFTSTAQEVYEVGQKVSNIVFNWTTNKDVTTQSLTDCPLADVNVRTATYTNDITSNKTFTLTIGDGQNTASKNISISFRNKIYYGSSVIPTDFDSAFILGLSNKQFATGKNGTYTVNVASNEYGFIAFPSSFGTLSSVKIGGFDTDVISCGTISFTNASGGTTNYNIYRTGRHSLGAITMVIN